MFSQSLSFISLLAIIVISNGFINLNEQFLVEFCFIAFITTVILYFGDSIKESLEQKQQELLVDHNEFITKTITLEEKLFKTLNNRINLINNLLILNEYFLNSIIKTLKNVLLQSIETFKETILIELQNILQNEIVFLPILQSYFLNFITSATQIVNFLFQNLSFSDLDEDSTDELVEVLVDLTPLISVKSIEINDLDLTLIAYSDEFLELEEEELN